MYLHNRIIPIVVMGLALTLAACDNILDTQPSISIDAADAIVDVRSAESAVRGLYDRLQHEDMYAQYLVVLPDLYADNLTQTGSFTTLAEFNQRSIFSNNAHIQGFWRAAYRLVNHANEVIDAVPGLDDLTPAQLDRFLGEAHFARALAYSHLVRYFGDVPIVLQPTRTIADADAPARSPMAQVYSQIESDLDVAAGRLTSTNSTGRATRWTARGLQVRVLLDRHQYEAAERVATEIIEEGPHTLSFDFPAIFESQNTLESLLEIQFTVNDPTSHSFWFFPRPQGRREYAPTQDLVASFEDQDRRIIRTIGRSGSQLYANKYFRISNRDDNVIAIRLAEIYLARAEARARQQNFDGAIEDINVIRNRAGLDDLSLETVTVDALIDAVLQERRLELAFEGHRFFDLRRTGRAQSVLEISQEQLLWPIPESEMDRNPNLVQNPGY